MYIIQFPYKNAPVQYLQVTPFDETEFVDSLREATFFETKEKATQALYSEQEGHEGLDEDEPFVEALKNGSIHKVKIIIED